MTGTDNNSQIPEKSLFHLNTQSLSLFIPEVSYRMIQHVASNHNHYDIFFFY